jgi:anthranilate 1,2-dioxygenase small subunit
MDEREIHYRVERLLTEYVRCIDDDRLEEWPDFFTDECFYQIIAASNHDRGLPVGLVYADSKGMLVDRVAALRQANIYEPQRYRHLFSAVAVLDSSDLERICVESHYLVVRTMQGGDSVIFSVGRYVDVVDLSGKKPLFRERRVIFDNERVDTMLAIPL